MDFSSPRWQLDYMMSTISLAFLVCFGISADISKFYNNLRLDRKHYRLHLAMWRPHLDPEEEAEVYVLLVHFYGVRSSGGLCMAAIKQIIAFARDE